MGQRQERADYFADTSAFSLEELQRAPAEDIQKILSAIKSVDLDIPENCSDADKLRYISEQASQRLLDGVMTTALPAKSENENWVDFSAYATNQAPPENSRSLFVDTCGVKIWKLDTPFPLARP